MLNPYFLSLELLVLVLFGLCLRHAWRQGWLKVWELLAGVIYGLLLERATIQQLGAYEYGQFLFMVGELPLAVGVAWGTIIYSVRLFSDASSLPLWLRPVLDGLLALNIDLAMDAVAIRLGMWDWGMGFRNQYFGVPYANFWAWFWVVFSFSF
ncbi:MAG: carotenoid biosynthesis protein, partial [Anaerolineales bacterium]|nr:carotenoid biosynthesis protein [Anaerolineales bacterium]